MPTALLTGSSKGIGRATALALLSKNTELSVSHAQAQESATIISASCLWTYAIPKLLSAPS